MKDQVHQPQLFELLMVFQWHFHAVTFQAFPKCHKKAFTVPHSYSFSVMNEPPNSGQEINTFHPFRNQLVLLRFNHPNISYFTLYCGVSMTPVISITVNTSDYSHLQMTPWSQSSSSAFISTVTFYIIIYKYWSYRLKSSGTPEINRSNFNQSSPTKLQHTVHIQGDHYCFIVIKLFIYNNHDAVNMLITFR